MIACCFWSLRPLTEGDTYLTPRWTWALSLRTLCWSALPPYLFRGDKGPARKRHACPPARWRSPRPHLRKQTFWAEASFFSLAKHEAVLFATSGSSTWLGECHFTGASRVTERAEEAWREAGEHRVAMGILRKTYSSGISCAHNGKICSIDSNLLVYTCEKDKPAWFLQNILCLNVTWFLMKHSCNLNQLSSNTKVVQ